MKARDVDPTLVNFLTNVVYAILLAAVILAALDTLGLPVTSLVAVVGAAGLAVGLALKDSLGNFASGVMLVMFRPFSKGDFVEVAGVSGSVDEVRIFSTILTTPDNKQVIIPNGQVAADTITNYTAKDIRRIDMVFGVGYDDDLKVAREVLSRICANHSKVLEDPATNVFVMNLGDSSVDFAVRPWARTAEYWGVRGDLLEQGKIELEAAGCNIPYPQTDVHLHHQNPLADFMKG
jgi:small conductance mechanosensitive channel